MPDALVGGLVQPLPAATWVANDTTQSNVSSTTYIAGSPTLETTFVAPPSGAVLLSVGLSARDDTGTNRIHLAPEIRVGSVTGSVALSANVATRGVGIPGGIPNYVYRARTTILTGLTPGTTYYARTMHKVSGGSTADINARDLTICPVPLGGAYAGQPVRAADWPPVAWTSDATTITNPTNTSYAAGSPATSTTFVAPTSGRVLIIIGGGLGNSAGANRIFLSPEVRLTDASGTVVLAPSVTNRGISSDNVAVGFHYGSRESVLEGLTPGQTYFIRTMHAVATDGGTNTGDIEHRDLGVVALP